MEGSSADAFFPIAVHFTAAATLCDVDVRGAARGGGAEVMGRAQVTDVVALDSGHGVRYSARKALIVDSYVIG